MPGVVGGPSYGIDVDPTEREEDANALYSRMPGGADGGDVREASRLGGGLLGWYRRERESGFDGGVTRLPADYESRRRYEDKGYTFLKTWGVSLDTPLLRGGVVVKRAEDKYEQLSRLVKQGVAPLEDLQAQYRPVEHYERADATRVDWRAGCICGEKPHSRFLFDIHLTMCEELKAAAIKAATPDPLACQFCDKPPFRNAAGLAGHIRMVHTPVDEAEIEPGAGSESDDDE